MADYVARPGQGAAVRDRQKDETPRRYKVLLHNDDFTSMDFVVLILRDVFRKRTAEAHQIMLHVHERGKGLAGVYVKSVAETKVATVHRLAREHKFPLRCSMEAE